jgi:hypothetical protein
MTLTLAKRTPSDIKGIIGRGLGNVHGDLPLQQALAADHIRSALYGHAISCAGIGILPALHTTRLLTSVRKTLDLLWPGASTHQLPGTKLDVGQNALERMGLAGDVFDTGGGFWVGTPFRLVGQNEGAPVLVAGGLPNAVVNEATGAAPISAGVARFCAVPSATLTEKLQTHVQSIDTWLGTVEPLREWTESTLAKHEQGMAADQDLSADQLEVYAPDVFEAQKQKGRWMPIRQASRALKGVRLCRPLSRFARDWDRPHYLAHFGTRSGLNAIIRSAPVSYNTTVRLRFGLDQILAAPRTAIVTVGTDTCEWEPPYGLPAPEARVLALGWPAHSAPNRHVFSNLALPLFEHAFRRLSIELIQRRGGPHA